MDFKAQGTENSPDYNFDTIQVFYATECAGVVK
jgi:hypothetical protein